ncbi:hypothetical protein IFM89_002493 [Coptis chinensis]|uniref:CCHC-type domain-containing protein n=1 Tax=Coptis chinensis TaxID=261450 RepID=A0A835HG66_9MAGN|nr:hypothetical protein IFM89_002493 [Coptis chinensis]
MCKYTSTPHQDRGCFSCGKLDHWIQNCPWNGSPCKRCDVGRVVRTSQQPHSFGEKFLSCPNPKCRGFQWMKDALKESIEQQTQQQPSDCDGPGPPTLDDRLRRRGCAFVGGGVGCGGVGCGGSGCDANFKSNPLAGGGGANPVFEQSRWRI